jgi:ATP-dependent DNA helicase DinG
MSWTDRQEELRAALPGYETRPQQTRGAQAVEKTLANGENLLLDAPTATGKSILALIPAIEHSLEGGEPVVVATGTKTLQDQYTRDLEFLRENLGMDFDFVVLKGKANYVCKASTNTLDPDEVFNQLGLLEELSSREDFDGDLSNLITEISPLDRRKITVTSEECGGTGCPFFFDCYHEGVKERARNAQVIVVNHHLLCIDAQIRHASRHTDDSGNIVESKLIPDYGALVVDEAHQFLEVATAVFGDRLTERSLTQLAADCYSLTSDDITQSALNSATRMLFRRFADKLGRDRTIALPHRSLIEAEEEFIAVMEGLSGLSQAVSTVDVHGDDRKILRRDRLIRRIQKIQDTLSKMVLAESDELVRWAELESQGSRQVVTLQYAPLDPSPMLKGEFWDRHSSVLMSATLAIGGSFSYISRQLGVTAFTPMQVATPFDYPQQAGFFCPENCDPKIAGWQAKVGLAITKLVLAGKGRALLLFTSRSALEAAWEFSHEAIEEAGYRCLKQESGGNTKALGEEFKTDVSSVLFALKSFMVGFDCRGESLSMVILDKLPFPVPSDVITKARADQVDARAKNKWVDGSFPTMTIPAMSMVLQQAVGRLLRSREDYGLCVLLDSRVHTKKYGATIMHTLPPARRIADMDEAVRFLEAID